MAFLRGNLPIDRSQGRHLPHWFQEGCTAFVTARLADSLPPAAHRAHEAAKHRWLQARGIHARDPDWRDRFAELPAHDRAAFHEAFTEAFQRLLDRGHGSCLLREPGVAALVDEAMEHFDGERYDLGERVQAGNHLHVVLTPRPGFNFQHEVTSWKRITAKRIHALRGTSGRIWQPESYDHLIRSPVRLRAIEAYILAH